MCDDKEEEECERYNDIFHNFIQNILWMSYRFCLRCTKMFAKCCWHTHMQELRQTPAHTARTLPNYLAFIVSWQWSAECNKWGKSRLTFVTYIMCICRNLCSALDMDGYIWTLSVVHGAWYIAIDAGISPTQVYFCADGSEFCESIVWIECFASNMQHTKHTKFECFISFGRFLRIIASVRMSGITEKLY